jgi:TnpA family transposase
MGRLERAIFTCDWLLDPELRRRSNGNLNKGESRHALARAVFFHRLGELRDRTAEDMAVPVHGRETPICAYAAMGSWPI